MKFEMVMPKMGESIMDGTILKWLKGVGDTVEKDETILEISTDKVDSEIPSPCTGTIAKLVAQEGDTIDVGLTIALIETDSDVEASTVDKPTLPQVDESPIEPKVITKSASDVKVDKSSSNKFFSPVVINIANENSISLSKLEAIAGVLSAQRVQRREE